MVLKLGSRFPDGHLQDGIECRSCETLEIAWRRSRDPCSGIVSGESAQPTGKDTADSSAIVIRNAAFQDALTVFVDTAPAEDVACVTIRG